MTNMISPSTNYVQYKVTMPIAVKAVGAGVDDILQDFKAQQMNEFAVVRSTLVARQELAQVEAPKLPTKPPLPPQELPPESPDDSKAEDKPKAKPILFPKLKPRELPKPQARAPQTLIKLDPRFLPEFIQERLGARVSQISKPESLLAQAMNLHLRNHSGYPHAAQDKSLFTLEKNFSLGAATAEAHVLGAGALVAGSGNAVAAGLMDAGLTLATGRTALAVGRAVASISNPVAIVAGASVAAVGTVVNAGIEKLKEEGVLAERPREISIGELKANAIAFSKKIAASGRQENDRTSATAASKPIVLEDKLCHIEGDFLEAQIDTITGKLADFEVTEPVVINVTGLSASAAGIEYQKAVSMVYGETEECRYRVDIDGKIVNGIADHVIKDINRREVAIEAKYVVKTWKQSMRHPSKTWGGEQQEMLDQAKKYSARFVNTIYHTNSVELAKYYNKFFKENGLNNIEFKITPAIKCDE